MIAFGNKLATARLRARYKVIVQALLAAVLVGSAALLGLALVGMLPRGWLGPFVALRDEPLALLVPLIAALAVFGAALAAGAARLPDTVALARRADRVFGFRETVSTVAELEARGQRSDSPVLGALYRAATADGDQIEPERLVPIRLPRIALLVPLLLAATALVMVLTPQARLAEARAELAATPSQSLEEDERDRIAADIARVTETIEQQVESVPNPYMEAVARTLESLSDRIEGDPGLSREELAQALSELAVHTEQATGSFPQSLREQIAEVLDVMADLVAAPVQVAELEEGGGEALPDARLDPDTPGASGAESGDAGPSERGDLGEMLDAIEENRQNLGAGVAEDTFESPPTSGGYMEAALERQRMAQEEAAELAAQAQVIGAAADSEAGESDFAGEGTDVLDRGGAGEEGLEFEMGEDLTLAANPSGEGRRFEMDLPPEAAFSPPDFSVALPEGSAWVHSLESTAQRNPVALINRDAVSIYLQALTSPVAAPDGGMVEAQ